MSLKQIELTNGRNTTIPDMANWSNMRSNGTHKVGEYSGNSTDPLILAYSGSPITVTKHSYSGPEFWQALEGGERELLINKAKLSDAAGAIFESIKLNGLDFNNADDLTIGGQMVNAGILIQARLDELVG